MDAMMPARPILIYDGDCDFCALWVDHWKRLTGDRVEYARFQDVESQYPQITHEQFERGVQLVMPDGTVYRNAEAVFRLLRDTPRRGWLLWMYARIPGFAAISEWVYRRVANHRTIGYHVTKALWGNHLGPHSYVLTRWVFLRVLGMIFFTAFASLSVQILGLVGSGGILPAARFLQIVTERVPSPERYLSYPTLMWLNSGDGMLQLLCVGGMVLSVLLILDFAPALMMALIWFFYRSLVTVGQDFLSFQWDSLLLEAGFLAILFASVRLLPRLKGQTTPSLVVIYLFRWLLFRLMFSSGAVKLLSEDPVWLNLTALEYHYWTQPIPTPLAWFVHQFPPVFHQASVLMMYVIELVVPFLYFMPRRLRFIGAALTTLLMVMILLTGNYTFFNILTIALCIPLIDDDLLRRFVPRRLAAPIIDGAKPRQPSVLRRAFLIVVALVILLPSIVRFAGTLRVQINNTPLAETLPAPVNDAFNIAYRARLVGGYGLFANMTTTRPEILVEGSNDGETWLPYTFRYKVEAVDQMPPWIAPHQPRLDWQMWFAALGGSYRNAQWFVAFSRRLLTGELEVLALLEHNPFPDAPPRFVRATLVDYTFTDAETRDLTGAYWRRGNPREFLPAVSLDDFG